MQGSMPKQSFLRSYSCPHLRYAVLLMSTKLHLKTSGLKMVIKVVYIGLRTNI